MDLNSALLLAVVASVGVGVGLLAWTMARITAAMASKTAGTLDDLLTKTLRGPLAALATLLTCTVGLVLLSARIDGGAVDQARRLLAVLFVVLAAWTVIRLAQVALERLGERRRRLRPATRVGSRLVAIVLYTMAFLMVLSTYGLSITPVLTGLGIAGLAVALALQDTGANFFAGIWIQTGRPLQPGHYVRLESEKLEGFVETVGWRVTSIRTLAGNTIVVPNNKLAQTITTDYNLPDRTLVVNLRFRAAFDADPDLVMRVLVEEAKAMMEENDGVVPGEPFAQLFDIGDDANVYEVSFKVTEFVQQGRAQQEMRLRVLRRLQKERIRIPYPTKHNLQEPVVAPAAKGKPEASKKPASGRRPPRPSAKAPTAKDPLVVEAERAKKEIARQQAEKQAEAEGKEADKAVAAKAGPEPPRVDEASGEADDAEAPAKDKGDDGDKDPRDGKARAAKDRDGEGPDDGGEKPANPLTRSG